MSTLAPPFGPLYAETDFSRFPVEPFNTFSNLAFLLVLALWLRQLWGKFREYPLFGIALPVLGIGFVGGTIFHATRSHPLWLLMDFLPIMMLSGMGAIWCWRQYFGSWLYAILLGLLPLLAMRMLRLFLELPPRVFIPLGYSSLAITVLLPAIVLCHSRAWRAARWLRFSLYAFAIALCFRQMDLPLATALPSGTHFLWHLFGAAATYCMLQFLFQHHPATLAQTAPKLSIPSND